MSSSLIFRPYENRDFVQCEKFAQEFLKTSVFKDAGYKSSKVKNFMKQAADPSSNVFACVSDLDGLIIGVFVGYVSEYWFSSKNIAQDLFVTVIPKRRSHAYMCISRMVSAFESWSRAKKAIEICIGSSTALANDNYKNFLKRSGYKEVGFIVKKEI